MTDVGVIYTPVDTDSDKLIQDAFDSIKDKWPDWEPAEGNLETWILAACARMVAEARDVASEVPPAIFRYFGKQILGVVPLDPTPSTVDSTWTVSSNPAGRTIAEGTLVALLDDAGVVVPFEVTADVTLATGVLTTPAGAVNLRSVNDGAYTSGLGGVGVTENLLDAVSWVSSVTLTGISTGGTDGESDSEYLGRLAEFTQLMTPRPVLASDFAKLTRYLASLQGIQTRAVAIDNYNPAHNKMSANQSSIETDASGWTALTNCSVARVTAQAADGSASLSLASTAAGTMAAITSPNGTSGLPVDPNDAYVAIASFRSAVSARAVRVGIRWYDSGGSAISTAYGAAANDATSSWLDQSAKLISPSNAAFAAVVVEVQATGGAVETHYVDKASLRRGDTVDWVVGDTAESGLERYVTVSAVELDTGDNLPSTVRDEIVADLDDLRELNFVIKWMDPIRTAVDVTFSAKALPGFVESEVEAAAEAAVADYLDPASWGNSPSEFTNWYNQTSIRRLELATVINNVAGIDYIETLTVGIAGGTQNSNEVNYIGGAVALATAGTISGTVT